MKKGLLVFLISILIINVVACKETTQNTNQIGEEVIMNIENIPSSVRAAMSNRINSSAIVRKYGKADIKRKLENKSYEIRYLDDESKLIVVYDNDTNRVIDLWKLNKLLKREDFQILVGKESLFNDVINIDPYAFKLETSAITAISEHKLVNNEVAIISYINRDKQWLVDKIDYVSPDPSEFTSILLEEDISLIQ